MYYFLDSEELQGDDAGLDDEALRILIHKRIENLERRLQAYKNRRYHLFLHQ